MAFDVLELLGPAGFVHAVGLELPILGNGVEASLGDGEERAAALRFEPELDERRGLARIVDVGTTA